MNILVIAGLYDFKLKTTLDPLLELEEVDQIYLARREPIQHKKVRCFSPPEWIQPFRILSELCRIGIIFFLCLTQRIDRIIGIHYIYHGFFAGIFGLLFRKPYYISIIENPGLYGRSKFFSFIIKRAQCIYVRGTNSQNYVEKKYDIKKNKIVILPDCFDFPRMNGESKVNKKYDIIYIGRLAREKRIDILLNVIKKVKSDIPHVRLCLIGKGEWKEFIEQKIIELEMAENVDVLGYVEDIYPYLKQSKIYMLTSETEGLPTTLIEALACGLPCIVSDVGDNTDLARHEGNALVCESGHVDQFAQSCLRLLEDQELYSTLCRNAQKMAEEMKQEYSLQNVAMIYQKTLHQTL